LEKCSAIKVTVEQDTVLTGP